MNEIRDNLSRSKQNKEIRKKQVEENIKQIQTITRQLARVGGASSMFERIDQDLKRVVSLIVMKILFCVVMIALCTNSGKRVRTIQQHC